MKRVHIPALCFALLALGAFAVTSADATEWLDNGAVISASEAVSAEGTLTLKDLTNGVEVACEGEALGRVGAGVLGEITAIEKLGKLGKVVPCKLLKAGTVGCEEPTRSEAIGLAWFTELTITGYNVIEGHLFGPDPGWKTECMVAGFFKVADECSRVITSTEVKNNLGGTVELHFFGQETTCVNGDRGAVTGTISVALSNGHSLSAS